MVRHVAMVVLVAVLLTACSVKSTPGWKLRLEACQEIKDEALRVECIIETDVD